MTGILSKRGINAQRKIFSGRSSHDDELTDLVTTPVTRFILRAVVVDVIFDPNVVPTQIRESLAEKLIHPELLQTAPRNSIVARVISGAADKRNSTINVFYPAMSHTHQPLKPGEQVWVFFEDPQTSDQGFWLSRIAEPVDIDDPNFTHGDRKFIDQRQPTTIDRLQEAKQLEGLPPETQARLKAAAGKGPQFPNGGDTEESYSLAEIDAYEKIEQDATANKIITKEPVPRYNKRPADWAAEGSNNSLIVLGEDRTGAVAKASGGKIDSKPSKDKSGSAGMFDFVTGRGIGKERKLPSPGAPPTLTAPRVIENSRKKLETDKEISKANANEGDPDFEYDAARVYGAMNTDVDGNFGKVLPKLPGKKDPEKINQGSAVVVKANHVRIIAREDGTIRIIKEGTLDDENGKGHAGIIIEKDGTVVVDGPKIIIGSGIEKGNGAGTQVFLGLDATESIVLGDTMKKVLTDYSTQVKSAIDTFCQALAAVGTQIAVPPGNLGNFGLPIAGLIALGKVFDGLGPSAVTALKMTVDQATTKFQNDLTTTLSKNGKTK